MRLLSPERAAERIEHLVHFDTQRTSTGLDLTVGAVHRLTGAGQLDFGGGEYEAAAIEPMPPEKYRPDDAYGWWELRPGVYLVQYNEHVAPGEDEVAFVFPHERLLKAGARHPAFRVDEARRPLEAILVVGERGLRLKENSRLSTLILLEV